MSEKAHWGGNSENVGQPRLVMDQLQKIFRVNTTPSSAIQCEDQMHSISAAEGSLQQARQILRPKTSNHNYGLRKEYLISYDLVINKNLGSPKGSNAYSWTRNKNLHSKSKILGKGDGVSVVLASILKTSSKEGKQFNPFLDPMSGRPYSTGSSKKRNIEVIREIECSYKQLFNMDIYKSAYQKLRSKPGNMTPGVDSETLDGISKQWAETVIEGMKNRDFKFKPSTRVLIPKPNGKMRPLGIPTPKDKIVQQAIRILFESVYEPKFSNHSHGFRPNRSTTTAVFEVRKWNGITWMIEGDIKGFFDNIDHHKLAELLKREIKDPNLIDLYWKLVAAGYVNNGKFESSFLGVPQGGVLSPLLSNVYLHEFDKFMEELISKYTDYSKRVSKHNPRYDALRKQISKFNPTKENSSELLRLKLELQRTPAVIRDSTTGTRVYYNRYADDWVIGISASLEFAEQIKAEVKQFLNDMLLLTLSEEKTKITHLVGNKVKYLGFYLSRKSRRYTESLKSEVTTKIWGKSTDIVRRATNVSIIVEAPIDEILDKLVEQKFARIVNGKPFPCAVTKWIYMRPEDIILRYNAIIRGILEYYQSVENKNQLSYVMWILTFSAVFTLCRKLNISPRQIFNKFGNPITVKFLAGGKAKSIELLYPKTLARDRTFKLDSYLNADPFKVKHYSVRTHHSWDASCKICGSSTNIEMHHVKHIKSGKVTGFTQVMKQLKRKQIPVCRPCHLKIHSGKYDGITLKK
jgi:group II intron reverse transcriptase/maturase